MGDKNGIPARVRVLESEMKHLSKHIDEVKTDLTKDVDELKEDLKGRLDKIMWLGWGILGGVTTAVIVLIFGMLTKN